MLRTKGPWLATRMNFEVPGGGFPGHAGCPALVCEIGPMTWHILETLIWLSLWVLVMRYFVLV